MAEKWAIHAVFGIIKLVQGGAMSNKRYFQFPLMLIKKIHTNHDEAMEGIVSFAIVDYALKQEVCKEDAAKQALYNYSRGGGLRELKNQMDIYVSDNKITPNELFEKNKFNPEDGMFEIIELFEGNNSFRDLAIKNCQLSKINTFFEIAGPDNDTLLTQYNNIKHEVTQHEEKFGPEPMPTIEKELFFDFKNKPQPFLFAAYIAIRSLQGQKNFIATTRNVIFMRMLGAKSNKALADHLHDKYIAEIHHRFTRTDNSLRYNFNKIFNQLLNRGLLKSKIFERSVSRKIFLSTTIDHDQLADNIIKFALNKKHQKKEYDAQEKIKKAIN